MKARPGLHVLRLQGVPWSFEFLSPSETSRVGLLDLRHVYVESGQRT